MGDCAPFVRWGAGNFSKSVIIMNKMQVLDLDQSAAWEAAAAQCFQTDFYFLPPYHRLAEQQGEGCARLFVYREGDHLIALPLLLREIDTLPGRGSESGGAPETGGDARWMDATSVYGYAGPLASHRPGEMPAEVVRNFHAALTATLREMRVVAIFSRLHPLIEQAGLLDGLGHCELSGRTVSIDLAQSEASQRAAYRSNHRRAIEKLRRLGAQVVIDHEFRYLDRFRHIYHETMQRVGARMTYFFDENYFAAITAQPGVALIVGLLEGEVLCAGLFFLKNGIAQYHLGGTATEHLKHAPMKLLMDGVCTWARAGGAKILHLGGGVSGQEDSLFMFKAGFSDRRHEFLTWRWIVDPDGYRRLCDERSQWIAANGLRPAATGYFPAYRVPVQPAAVPATA